jgi:beta-lactamase superfamily II metal-dependent hydrolase
MSASSTGWWVGMGALTLLTVTGCHVSASSSRQPGRATMDIAPPRADEFSNDALVTHQLGMTPLRETSSSGDSRPLLLRMTTLDVGQGDAILIQLEDLDILVDGGTALGWERSLRSAMELVDGDLEYFFVTHPHVDHFEGAIRLFSGLNVLRVITNGERREMARWLQFESSA